eukprot:1138647-Pelagomonas_calceolata.AAC.4
MKENPTCTISSLGSPRTTFPLWFAGTWWRTGATFRAKAQVPILSCNGADAAASDELVLEVLRRALSLGSNALELCHTTFPDITLTLHIHTRAMMGKRAAT